MFLLFYIYLFFKFSVNMMMDDEKIAEVDKVVTKQSKYSSSSSTSVDCRTSIVATLLILLITRYAVIPCYL